MNNLPTLLKTLSIPALSFLIPVFSYAEIQLTGACHYIEADSKYGKVLKIGYKGSGSATVQANTTWNTEYNILVGCCPDNYSPAIFKVLGTANTKSVYVSGKIRDGECYVEGGTWNCNGLFYLGQITPGILSISNNGAVSITDTFYMNYGSTLSIGDTSTLTFRLESDGTFGTNGGIHVFNDLGGTFTLSAASNLVIDASNLASTPTMRSRPTTEQSLILEDFITVERKYAKTLSTLTFSVGGNTFKADDEDALNKHLSGITVLGFEDYAKSFVIDTANQTVALHLSKIPEPSAFGLFAGTVALGIVCVRRRRSRA